MKIARFEDLLAWQEARKLVAFVYRVTKDGGFSSDRELVRQMRRASVSVMANLAEGFSRYSLKVSKVFFVTSRSSLEELRSHSYVALDQGYLAEEDVSVMRRQMEIVGKLVSGLIRNSRVQLSRTRNEPLSDSAIQPLSVLNK